MERPYDPAFPLLGMYSKKHETWNTNSKGYVYPYVHCSFIYNSQDLEAVQMPTSQWVDKDAVEHSGILLSYKKEGNLTFHDSIDGPREYYAK